LLRAGAARALLEPLFARPPRDGESLRDFLVARFGRKAGALASAAMAAGVYAGDPARLSAQDAFPSLSERGSILLRAFSSRRERGGLWSLARGLGSLPAAAAAKLGSRVRLATRAAQLEPAWSVNGERFDAAILALPARDAAQLLRPLLPALATALGGFRFAPVTLVHLGFAARALPRGFGLIDADGALHATGTLLPSSMLPGRAPEGKTLATAVCGGALHPERAALPDSQLADAVLADLRRLFGLRRDPEYLRIVRHTAAIPQYEAGHRARVLEARKLLAQFPRIELAGASYDGVSVPEAAHSGAAAAARLLA
jgi:oxygen-dependent protoporphyrinogen oxidase